LLAGNRYKVDDALALRQVQLLSTRRT